MVTHKCHLTIVSSLPYHGISSTATMRIRLFIAFIALLPSYCLAQGDDFGTKLSAEVRKVFNRKTSIDFGAEMRTRDRMKATDRWAGLIEAHYKVLPWLKASMGLLI